MEFTDLVIVIYLIFNIQNVVEYVTRLWPTSTLHNESKISIVIVDHTNIVMYP